MFDFDVILRCSNDLFENTFCEINGQNICGLSLHVQSWIFQRI